MNSVTALQWPLGGSPETEAREGGGDPADDQGCVCGPVGASCDQRRVTKRRKGLPLTILSCTMEESVRCTVRTKHGRVVII